MKRLVSKTIPLVLIFAVILTGCARLRAPIEPKLSSSSDIESGWQEAFDISSCTMATTGQNQYFILEPGFQLVLEGGRVVLNVTVLDETEEVDGVMTRVVEEREWMDGELIEVSRNFFAMCEETKDVFYFGEDVDIYKEGKVTSHSGAWRSGEGNAKFGLFLPGQVSLNLRFYNEIAPNVALDRVTVISMSEIVDTPAGVFTNCLKLEETTPLQPGVVDYKYYATGIGIVQDGSLKLVKIGEVDEP